ncbi:MAG: cyclic nucleotide-binding domain-containing protein [Gaiellaceae bacterium]
MSPQTASATVHELSRVGLLAELPGERLATLAARMSREYVAAGTEIVREGEFGSRFYVVLAGLLAVSQDARGERALLRPGDYFGEVAPAMGIRRTASVRSISPSTVASCDRATFDEFVKPLLSEA